MFGGNIKDALIHAASQYDMREMKKRGYNHYALAQYFSRIDDVLEDIERGAGPRQALLAAFNGRLLDHLLKAIGEPKFTRDEMNRQGYVYRSVTDPCL
jgi:hypothetical protein